MKQYDTSFQGQTLLFVSYFSLITKKKISDVRYNPTKAQT